MPDEPCALITLDEAFHVVDGAAPELIGRPISDLLGEELFGPAGTLRALMEKGERQEGWRATMHTADGPRAVSLTAAALTPDRVRYIVVLQPADASPGNLFGMIGRSAPITKIYALVQSLQNSDATVLLTGEGGTGHGALARAIHASSMRCRGRFVTVDCAALPGELLEPTLFGDRERAGRLELAAGGTLFLDEIGDVPLHLQARLLRVLQDGTFERAGESAPRSADARIIAATSVDLHRAIAESRFREDLYYRLRVVPIEIPPLRARREDIEPLAADLLTRVAARHGREVRFSPEAMRALLRYRWPGNVRELENAVEYAVAVVKGPTIHADDLPLEVQEAPEPPAAHAAARGSEAALIRNALEAHRWNREATARALGMSRTTLWRKMRELGLT